MGSNFSKSVCWFVFLVGLAAAVVGITELHVESAVCGLIAASTSGLILLKMRAEALGRFDGLDRLETTRRAIAGTLTAPRM
ncbi:hypothetical protein [Antrihabitans spumae]|uniref:Uncharacterized protein n=1 Tax=Antrihabitans spumae TaxID=3373370 RepID=A0ABW7KTA4_9NOCA